MGPPKGSRNNPNWGGWPLPDDQYRCTFIKRDGTRCKKWAKRGTDRCSSKRHQRRGYQYKVGVQHLPRLYSRAMTQTLADRVDAQLAVTRDEQLELYEELALIRESANEAVRLYALAQAGVDATRASGNEPGESLLRARDDAAGLMVDHLNHVKEYAQAIARVQSLTKEKLTSHTLYGVVHQIVRKMYDVCGTEHEDIARALEQKLRQEIVLPEDGKQGTTLTPDADVSEMDGMIPTEPE